MWRPAVSILHCGFYYYASPPKVRQSSEPPEKLALQQQKQQHEASLSASPVRSKEEFPCHAGRRFFIFLI